MKQGRQPWRYGRHAHGAGTATLAPRARGRKVTLGDRLRYRVDNAFSRGSRIVILWLAAITAGIVVGAAVVLTVFGAGVNDEKRRRARGVLAEPAAGHRPGHDGERQRLAPAPPVAGSEGREWC